MERNALAEWMGGRGYQVYQDMRELLNRMENWALKLHLFLNTAPNRKSRGHPLKGTWRTNALPTSRYGKESAYSREDFFRPGEGKDLKWRWTSWRNLETFCLSECYWFWFPGSALGPLLLQIALTARWSAGGKTHTQENITSFVEQSPSVPAIRYWIWPVCLVMTILAVTERIAMQNLLIAAVGMAAAQVIRRGRGLQGGVDMVTGSLPTGKMCQQRRET